MIPRLFLIGAVVLMGSGSAWASPDNPFGFETNKHPLEYGCSYVADDLFRGYGYTCAAAPRDHPDMTYYTVQFVPDVGGGVIEAIADKIQPDAFAGLAAKLRDQITEKYGPELEPLRDDHRVEGKFKGLTTFFWIPKEGTAGIGDVVAIRLRTHEALARKGSSMWIQFQTLLHTKPACQTAMDQFDQEEAEQNAQQGRKAF